MHNYHKMAPGGLELLGPVTLHKGGAAHERYDQCPLVAG